MFLRKISKDDKKKKSKIKFNPGLSLSMAKTIVYSKKFSDFVSDYLEKTGKTKEQLDSDEILDLYSKFLEK